MRIIWLFTAVLLWTTTARTDEASLGEQLEKVAPHAAGIALVEVTEVKEVDQRPSDGPLSVEVRFQILRSSGELAEGASIIKALGGLHAGNSPPFKPYGPVKADTFKQGSRYWVAFSSKADFERNPQGIVATWPEIDAPAVLEEAVRTDFYIERPQYDPRNGLTYRYRAAADRKSWQVRMQRDGKLLWEVDLPGRKFENPKFAGEWRMLHRDHWLHGLEQADASSSGWFLLAQTVVELAEGNEYQLPAGQYRATYALDADTGRKAAIWVSILRLDPISTPSVIQYYDQKNGSVRREERYALLATGGLAVGANTDSWYRKLVRTYDVNTARLKAEETFRHTSTPEGSKFVPVNR